MCRGPGLCSLRCVRLRCVGADVWRLERVVLQALWGPGQAGRWAREWELCRRRIDCRVRGFGRIGLPSKSPRVY